MQDTAEQLAAARAMVDEARRLCQWQELRYRDVSAQLLEVIEQKQALLTRAEAAESILDEVTRAARYADRLLCVAPSPKEQLCVVYELGTLVLLKLLRAPPPPHPRVLLDEAFELLPARSADGARAESRVDDEDPTIAAISAAVTGRLASISGDERHQGDAHARARYHQGKWAAVAASAGGAAAAAVHASSST